MLNNDQAFHPNGYNSAEYRSLNYSYQQKMTELFSHRRINYPAKKLQFEIETINLTSTMSQQQYLRLQSLVAKFPKKQRNGEEPVTGQDDYQSIILYHDYKLFDATQYVVRSPLGFGYTVSQYFAITSERIPGSPSHDVKVTLTIHPNRFLNVLEEPLIRLLVEKVLPILTAPQISKMVFTLDMPLIMNNFHVQMTGEIGTRQHITQELNAHQEYELSRIEYDNPEGTRQLTVYNKFQSLLDNQLLVADTNYISAREAAYYRDQADNEQFLTRISLAVSTPNAVMRYMKNHEWLMRDITIEYRDNSGIQRFSGTEHATNGKDFRRSFNRMLTYRLKEIQKRARQLPYLTANIWQNTFH
ncbi:hypothetical protein [Lentilactobacillus kefiri]|uniref:Uncharacterized protein n=2 Tax=Lentilactobacillus kefiri TaxID=33962 RepID=A0A8E1RGK7_LENKE|nr:hypothetical protein [Lentilactobacillus kefiri]KRL73458.1 hypothetical protein FD08_GL002526 [Lentilactobacillus parakefiri DSM 10551]KRM49683.1 hypothetical protein FC95_GL000303 [Lentilactobacillus kefiri DSM 20587 = JCM 5818]MCJ2162475.1 hypothetical protein [Lentilactobacillus kefiri]MCP9369705.1 hypothetical protein [Lentilactobacillus kefiri]MDH5109457.1 hypothetical protein [Lentilactobacillus kefiri]